MATFWPKHGPTGLNFDDFFDYFVFCVGSADEAEPCKLIVNCCHQVCIFWSPGIGGSREADESFHTSNPHKNLSIGARATIFQIFKKCFLNKI